MSISMRWMLCGSSVLALTMACSSSEKASGVGNHDTSTDSGADGTSPGGGGDDCPVVVSDSKCDKSIDPFVFVHGTYGSGDNFAHVASLLTSNGFCPENIVAVEYNSLGEQPGADCTGDNMPAGCGKVDKVVDEIMAKTGAKQVTLAGHSQGTAHCGTYLGKHADKVGHYINFSGSPPTGDTPTLSMSSHHDLGGTPHHATGNNVTVVTLDDEDHFAVAASTRSFKHVYNYLTGNDPKYETIQCGDPMVTVEGLAETFADNVPVNGKVEIRALTNKPRDDSKPEATLSGDPSGHFQVQLRRNVPYEFKGFDGNGQLVGYVYFSPFKRTNRLVRLLSPASADDGTAVGGTIAMASTDKIVHDAAHVAVVGRWAGGGFRQDLGASLKIDGNEVLTEDNAGSKALMNMGTAGGVVGFFMYDANKNKQTDLGMVDSGPFLMFTDVFMDASKPAFIEMNFVAGSEDENEKVDVKLSNWPSTGDDGKPVTLLTMFQ